MNYYDYRTYFNEIIALLEQYLPENSEKLDSILTSLDSIMLSLASILATVDNFLPFIVVVLLVSVAFRVWH